MTETNKERLIRVEERQVSVMDKIKNFVTKEEFTPIKMLVYGLVALIVSTVFYALLRSLNL